MKIISWNINGIKSWSETDGVLEFVENENPDIFCVQEIKSSEEKVRKSFSQILPQYPYQYFHFAEKKGYSGTAIFSKYKPKSVEFGLGGIDTEGRAITVEFEKFYLLNVYTPNSKMDFSRLDYRINTWDSAFVKKLKSLKEQKEVMVCGDMNVLERDIDLQNHQFYFKNEDFRKKIYAERKSFERFLDLGFTDIYRKFYPEEVVFSWVGPKALQLPSTRLDYFLLTKKIEESVKDIKILNFQDGSDHFPISLEMNFVLKGGGGELEKIYFPESKNNNIQESLF